MPTLIAALRRDFEGYEHIRGYLLRAPKYGNDDPAADRHVDRIMSIFAHALSKYRNTRGGPYWAGFYSVTAHKAFGETTGALEQMLTKVSDFYDSEVKATVDGLTSLIEPLLIAVMGLIVGGIVIALFMPILQLSSLVQG